MKLRKVLLVAILSGIAFTSCKDNKTDDDIDDRMEMERMEADREAEMRADRERLERENNINARLQANQNLTTFNEGWNRNQISQNLDGTRMAGDTTTARTAGTTQATQGSYTIFAPSNEAYAALTEAQRTQLNDAQRRDRNVASMNYLMVNQRVTADQLKQQIQSGNGKYAIKTMQGENITASIEGDNIILTDAAGNKARVIESDNEGSNGVIHIIDKVLWPKDPTKNEAATRTGTTAGTTTGSATP
ncbi:fasciclin domain-containing protein [Antarcticibacterium arcticum]|uniref:Fasciclin domain-containing protein n=1 Tax=Antarcticibacterium arcticum TaxID=2585771 RepID=A0A5B8YEG4_9FLAO|nr:fasciclin domain-containing protein [Antarcticibacterium arcticum]QED36285.1 fasciclin domain-containing protein [Antarcticibacterium arcticum]